MLKVLIIIPAYNEAENIEKVIEQLLMYFPQYDYLIVNDGSTDKTKDICMEKGYSVINLPINLGIGGAVQTGYRYAFANNYDIAIQMDGDGQHDPFFLTDMIDCIEKDVADVVVGSRFINKNGFQSSLARRTGIVILSWLGWLLTGIRLRDITSGYRVVNKHMIDIYSHDYPSDYPEPEAMIIAAIWGCRIKEYPVEMKEREGGTSSITIGKSLYYMIKVSLAMIIRRLSLGFRRAK